jgi:hypothetical protein
VTATAVIALRSFGLAFVVRSLHSIAPEAAITRGFSKCRECRSCGLGLLLSL